MPAGSNPAKMRRAAVTGSRNAAMPAITAPGAPANAGPLPGGDGLRVHHNGRDGDRQGLPRKSQHIFAKKIKKFQTQAAKAVEKTASADRKPRISRG